MPLVISSRFFTILTMNKHITNKNKILTVLGCGVALLFTGSSAYAAATVWTGTTNDVFGTAGNWTNNAPGEDGADSLATIGNGDTVNLTTAYTSSDPFRLELQGNSTLNVSAAVTVNRLTDIGAGSTLNLLDGSAFTMPKISSGNNEGWTIDGTLEISGGTHAFNERLFGSGTIRVVGNDSDIHFNQIVNALNYEFEFDATGVSSLIGGGTGIGTSGAGPYWSALGTSTLTVDGSAFNGTGAFTLLETTSNAASTFNMSNVTITGLGAENVGWTLEQGIDGSKNIITLNVIPEPSSAALLGLGGLALILRRRK